MATRKQPWQQVTPLRLIFCALTFTYVALMIINFRTSAPEDSFQAHAISNKEAWKIEPTGNLPIHKRNANENGQNTKEEPKQESAVGKEARTTNRSPLIQADDTKDKKQKQKHKAGFTQPQHPSPETTAKKARPGVVYRDKKERPVQFLVTKEEANKIEDPVKLHAELKSFYGDFVVSSGNNLWDGNTTALPKWMTTYLNWHKHHRQRIADNPDLYDDYRYMVMVCVRGQDYKCGGTSDRLKPIPWAIRLAYYTRRLIFIHWSRPASLEEFLVPPKGGLDWRAPEWLASNLEGDKYFGEKSQVEKEIRAFVRSNQTLIRSRLQSFHGGLLWYDEQTLGGEPKSAKLFHELWRIFFTPSAVVKNAIEHEMDRLGLVPGAYTGAHLRALYGIKDRQEGVKEQWAENAVNCASELRPKTPIFFASDSFNATYYAKVYAEERGARLVARVPNPNPPLHIDKVPVTKHLPPADYYDTFIDLYILAQADCITYNKGGYGIFALLIGRNSTCGLRQDAIDRPVIHNPCHWVDDSINGTNSTRDHHRPPNAPVLHTPIYVEPLDVTPAVTG